MLLFVPLYNCQNQITRLINKLDDDVLKFFDEILFIDNLSEDKTLSVLLDEIKKKKLNKKIKILQNKRNISLGGSHKLALDIFLKSKYDSFVIMHGDDQTDLKKLNFLLENKKNAQNFNLLGSRFHENSSTPGYSFIRTFGNKLFNILFTTVVMSKILDLGCGINLFKKKTIQNIPYHNFPNSILFLIFLNISIILKKENYSWFGVDWREEDQQSNVKVVKDTFYTLKILYLTLIRNKIFYIKNIKNLNNYEYKIIYKN